MEKEKQSINLCKELIERSLNWGDSQQWSRQDFEILSEKIYEKTQVRLSVSTLKRIWGKVRYDNSPTHATLNILAKFLGFENWRELEQKHPTQKTVEEIPQKRTNGAKRISKKAVRIFSMTAGVIGLTIVLLLVKGKTPVIESPENVVFKARKVSDDLPNSVVFTYDATAFKADSVFIQQSWDPQRRERVSPTGHQHTSIYYTPGYFIAKLIVNDEIKKEDIVFIKSKGWKGTIDTKPPIYLSSAEMKRPGSLGITSAIMREKTGESVFNQRATVFHNVREFDGLQGSAFTLDVKLKNTATVEECLCKRVHITVLTKGGAIIIPLSAKGCIAEIDLLAPDGWIDGKENDLSALGCDFKDFEHVVCQVIDQHLKVYLNGVLVLDRLQQRSVGEIIGLRFTFEGYGEVKEVKLSGPEKVVYEERFD